MKIKIYSAGLGLLICLFFVSSCVMPRTYGTLFHSGIPPISPRMNNGFAHRYRTIDTLSPQLKWGDMKTPNETYDVCVWETPYRSIEDIKQKRQEFESSWGIPVFYTNNIPTNHYQIPVRLKPNTYYNWSVRIREGEKVENWSTFTQQTFSHIYSNFPFGFKTPAQ